MMFWSSVHTQQMLVLRNQSNVNMLVPIWSTSPASATHSTCSGQREEKVIPATADSLLEPLIRCPQNFTTRIHLSVFFMVARLLRSVGTLFLWHLLCFTPQIAQAKLYK